MTKAIDGPDPEQDRQAAVKYTEGLIQHLLHVIGVGDKPGMKDTPHRVSKMWFEELLSGYFEDPPKLTVFKSNGYDELVVKKGIETYSLCAHHLLPFFGQTHIAYIPDGNILDPVLGISKLARVVDYFSRRLQTQEYLTKEVGDFLVQHVSPHIAVITEMRHLCEMMRGVQKQNTVLTCAFMHGVFKERDTAKQEFLRYIYHSGD